MDVLIRRNGVDPDLGYVVEVIKNEDLDEVVESHRVYARTHPLSPARAVRGDVTIAADLDTARQLTLARALYMMEDYGV